MTAEFILRFLLNHEVRFRTTGNADLTGEVSILGNGRVGILNYSLLVKISSISLLLLMGGKLLRSSKKPRKSQTHP